jgi:cysteine desulfurase
MSLHAFILLSGYLIFPIIVDMDILYLDNNATTRPAPEAVEAMLPYLNQWYGNPSSAHRFGQRARQGLETARGQVARLIGCAEAEVNFNGGGTEAINTAIRGLLAARAPRRRIITSTVEHSATRELCQQLAREGAEVVEIPVDLEGMLDWAAFEAALDDQTALVTMLWANNETGVLFPADRIAAACREKRVPFHCDATQAVGKIPVNAHELGFDVMSFAGHKFYGPKGTGGMYVRRGVRVPPLIIGGPQERGRRGGTENLPGVVGMGAAAEVAAHRLESDRPRIEKLRNRLEAGILERIEQARVNGSTAHRLPNTTNIGFARLEAEAILLLLSEQGVCASAGAACSSGSLEPSHVLRAMNVPEVHAHGAVRFSLGRYNTNQEVDRVMEILPGIIKKLREVLPVG